jgi:hypothetical protein
MHFGNFSRGGGGEARNGGAARAAREDAWMRQAERKWARREKGGAKKRPSVETEGRLTIACHMKILQKIDVDGTGFLCLFTIPFLPATQR